MALVPTGWQSTSSKSSKSTDSHQLYTTGSRMNQLPTLMPTSAADETYGGVTYHIGGELVPVLSVDVSRQPVFFEHHILLWKNSNVKIGLRPMKGALKRMMAGMQIFVTEASGNGTIAFSRDGAGHILPIHLGRGEELHVREHQFLAATANVEYTFERVRGIGGCQRTCRVTSRELL